MSRLFIGNLSYNASETDIASAFSDLGITVKNVKIIIDRETGKGKGFAFADLESDQNAQDVIDKVNGAEISGRSIRVDLAREKTNGGGGNRGGGFSRGREGGGGGFGGERRDRGWDRGGDRGGKRSRDFE